MIFPIVSIKPSVGSLDAISQQDEVLGSPM